MNEKIKNEGKELLDIVQKLMAQISLIEDEYKVELPIDELNYILDLETTAKKILKGKYEKIEVFDLK